MLLYPSKVLEFIICFNIYLFWLKLSLLLYLSRTTKLTMNRNIARFIPLANSGDDKSFSYLKEHETH